MRTVDPNLWYKKLKKSPINVSRPIRYGLSQRSRLEVRVRGSFGDAMREFWRNSTATSIRFVRRGGGLACVSRAFLVVCILLVGMTVVASYWRSIAARPPLMVSLQSSQYSAKDVAFPAVGICSISSISWKSLKEYSRYLYLQGRAQMLSNHTFKFSRAGIQQHLLQFGALIPMRKVKFDPNFMKYLDFLVAETNVTNIMYQLSPKCESMLKRCTWQAQLYPCARLFAPRITPFGFCCVFNSRYQPEDVSREAERLHLVGEDMGLKVMVTENPNDAAYPRRPMEGIDVLLFDGKQFPLAESGAMRMYPVYRNASAFLRLTVSSQETAGSLQYYSEAWRGCRMQSSGPVEEYRSQSWCVKVCRRDSVLALCSCVPYTMMPAAGDVVCSPVHLPCLFKYREKFSYFYPAKFKTTAGLSRELAESMDCGRCVPDCTRLLYSAKATFASLDSDKLFHKKFFRDMSTVNSTIISVFYASDDHYLYLVETYVRWYEIVSSLSSHWVILLGLTLVSILELFYHCTVRWLHHFRRRSARDKQLMSRTIEHNDYLED